MAGDRVIAQENFIGSTIFGIIGVLALIAATLVGYLEFDRKMRQMESKGPEPGAQGCSLPDVGER